MSGFYRLIVTLLKCIIWIPFRVRYEGRENLPAPGGRHILVANHIYMRDPVVIALGVPQQIFFMAKSEFFDKPLVAWFFRRVGAFPVSRGEGDMDSVAHAEELVDKGKLLGVFPEGRRNGSGKLLRPKSGTAFIARATGADVIPCAVLYGEKRLRQEITVRYGRPIPYAALGFADDQPASLRRASKIIMEGISALLPPEPSAPEKSDEDPDC